jgi:hypothetical protein
MSYDDLPRLFGYIPIEAESAPGTSRVHTWTLPTSGIMYASDHADSQRRRITSTLRSRNNKAHRYTSQQMYRALIEAHKLMRAIDAQVASVGVHKLTEKEWRAVQAQMSIDEKIAYYRLKIWELECMLNDAECPLDKGSHAHYSAEVARYAAQIADLEQELI